MATIASLVTQLIMNTTGFVEGLGDAEGRFAKFQKSLVGKTLGAGAILGALDKGFDALGEAMKRSVEGGENFVDVLQETATHALTTLPIIGGLNQATISLRDYLLGDAQALQEVNARLATVNERLGLTKAEMLRLNVAAGILKNLQNAVTNFGDSANISMLKAAGATDKAILAAQILEGQLESLQRRQQNQAAIDSQIRAIEQQVELFGASARAIALYEAAVLGASSADLEYINTLYDKLEAMQKIADAQKHQNELMDEGRRITESVRTAEEIYADTVKRLQELLDAGAISQETFDRAMQKAKDTLEGATKVEEKIQPSRRASEFQSPAAIERRFGAGMPTGNAATPELKTAKNTEQMLVDGRKRTSLQQQQLTILKEIRDRQPEVFGGNN